MVRIPKVTIPHAEVQDLVRAFDEFQQQTSFLAEDFVEWAKESLAYIEELEGAIPDSDDFVSKEEFRKQFREVDAGGEDIREIKEDVAGLLKSVEEIERKLKTVNPPRTTQPVGIKKYAEIAQRLANRVEAVETALEAIPNDAFEAFPYEEIDTRFEELEHALQDSWGEVIERLDQWEEDYNVDIKELIKHINQLKLKVKELKPKAKAKQ